MANDYCGWMIEDAQEETAGWYSDPIYSSWESTKNYKDTGEGIGFAITGLPSSGETVDAAEEEEESDDEVDEKEWDGATMTPSSRRVVQVGIAVAVSLTTILPDPSVDAYPFCVLSPAKHLQ